MVGDWGTGRNACATKTKGKGAGPAKFGRDANCAQEASGTKGKSEIKEQSVAIVLVPG